jgi:hypothetical protein
MEQLKDFQGPALPARAVPSPPIPRQRIRGLMVRAASDLPDLESCLALERRTAGGIPGRVGEPSAIPECDFLMAEDSSGGLLGVTRLLRHAPERIGHALPGSPSASRSLTGFALPAALLTAIRYSSAGVLEVGAFALAPLADPGRVSSVLWTGVQAAASRYSVGYLLGTERVEGISAPLWEDALAVLDAGFGLHPDLDGLPRLKDMDWRRGQGDRARPTVEQVLSLLPFGLREGLSRGCRLAGPPRRLAQEGEFEFTWIASRDSLDA